MLYLKAVQFTSQDRAEWPFALPPFRGLERLDFQSPITLLAGENGSGKSTLLEALAIALKLPAIGRTDAHRDTTLAGLHPFARSLRLAKGAGMPKARFFLRSEDFFGFVQRMEAQRKELEEEYQRARRENAHRSAFAQGQATMAYAGSLSAVTQRYGEDVLTAASHGESFLRLFEARMVPQGLYLLDEPEAPLSPLRQLALLSMIRRLSEQADCQFILATHSPILMALPGAQILNFDDSPLAPTAYADLESIALLKAFLANPSRMIERMEEED